VPDKEETRLLDALKDCDWLSRAASDALTRPMHSVIHGSDAHRKLVEAEAATRVNYARALLALRAYRAAEKAHVSGGGA
jgi:hypothetical protein